MERIKNYPLRIPQELHHRLRILAAIENITMRELIEKTLRSEIDRRDRSGEMIQGRLKALGA